MSVPRTLKSRSFSLIFLSQSLSWLGEAFYSIAVLWMVQEITGSKAMLGIVAACRSLPSLLGIATGVAADHLDRRVIMVVSTWLRGICVASLPILFWAGALQVWHIMAVALLIGVCGIFYLPARVASLPLAVEREQLVEANSLLTLSNQLMNLIGYSLGGILIAIFGTAPLFLVYSVCLIGSGFFALGLRQPALQERSTTPTSKESAFASMVAGLRYIGEHPALKRCLPLVMLLNFVLVPVFVLLPAWTKEVLSAGASTYGFLQSVTVLGMVVGAVMTRSLSARHKRSDFLLTCMLVQSAAIFTFTQSMTMTVAAAALFFFGFFDAMITVTFSSFVQRVVPGRILGRVSGGIETIGQVIAPAGQAMGGVLSQSLGLGAVLTSCALLRGLISGSFALVPGLMRAMNIDEEVEVGQGGLYG